MAAPAAPYPTALMNDDGKLVEFGDPRMPINRHLSVNKDLAARDIFSIAPNGNVSSFYRRDLGNPAKIGFNLVATPEWFWDTSGMYIEYGITPIRRNDAGTADVPLTDAEIDTWGLLPPSSSTEYKDADTAVEEKDGRVKFMAFPGTHAIFGKWTLLDYSGNPVIDELASSDIFTQINLSAQKPEFYDPTSTNRSDDYACSTRNYKRDIEFRTTNNPSPAGMIPWAQSKSVSMAGWHEAMPTTKNADGVTMAADNIAPVRECIRTARQMVAGKRFKTIIPLSYLRQKKFLYPHQNPMRLVIELNTFDQAFYALNSTCDGYSFTVGAEAPATGHLPAGAWSQTAYGVDYYISDIKLVIPRYRLTDEAKSKMEQLAKTGYWLDYSSVRHEIDDVSPKRTYTYEFPDMDIHNLQKVIILLREADNVKADVRLPKTIFTNGETIATQTKTEATWTKDDYDGLSSVAWYFGNKRIPTDAIKVAPYSMKQIRDLANEVFNQDESNIYPYHYEGLLNGKYVPGAATEYFIGWEFEKRDWAFKDGVNMDPKQKGGARLKLQLEFKNSGVQKVIDYFLIYGTEIHIYDKLAANPRY